jgi:ribosomal protein S18 acetylase RimI-like enzyme
MAVEFREVVMPDDASLIGGVDTSFETREVYRVEQTEQGFELVVEKLAQPRVKTFPLDDLGEGREWQDGWLALDGDHAVGFVATAIDAFNRRCVIWHLYVSPAYRRQGTGKHLLELALDRAAEEGATHAWLETTSLNVPGIEAYRRLGFTICGLDLTLYANTPASDEVALFFQRQLAQLQPAAPLGAESTS